MEFLALNKNNLGGNILLYITISGDLTFPTMLGPIFPSILKFSNLSYISIGFNSFTGAIPSEIKYLSNLQNFRVYYNRLNGVYYVSMTSRFVIMYIIGTVPSEIGSLTNINKFQASHNLFRGTIPSSIGNLTLLSWLDLSYNRFTGPIPKALGNLSLLELCSLSDNSLTGNFYSNINFLFYDGVGTIPSILFNLSNLNRIEMSSNKLNGDD
jgi:Leucine-rich repeat (LRR) protein